MTPMRPWSCILIGLLACNPPTPQAAAQGRLSGVVTERRAGAPVVGVSVNLPGTVLSTTTDANGSFKLNVPAEQLSMVTALELSKPGMAAVRVEGFDLGKGPVMLEEVMRPIFDPSLPAVPPKVRISTRAGDVFGDSVRVQVKTEVEAPERNRPFVAFAGLGASSGVSGFLNKGALRAVQLDYTGDELFELKGAVLDAQTAQTELHVVVYDLAYNRTHLIRPIGLQPKPANGLAPSEVSAQAVTFNDTSAFSALALRPKAASDGSLLFAIVRFKGSLTGSYELLRSLDGQQFSSVMRSDALSLQLDPNHPELGLVFRDASGVLSPNQPTYYKVASLGKRSESPVVSVTPLGRYSVKALTPAPQALGASRTPQYVWESTGASEVENALLVVSDRLQVDASSVAWQSSEITNLGGAGRYSVTHNLNNRANQPRLQANHAYDWQLSAVTYRAIRDTRGQVLGPDMRAVAIAADPLGIYAKSFGLLDATGNPITAKRDAPVTQFITGDQ